MKSYIKISTYIREMGEKMPLKVLTGISPYVPVISLRPWPLTSISISIHLCSNCAEVLDLVKFPQAVYKHRVNKLWHMITDSPNTKCLSDWPGLLWWW